VEDWDEGEVDRDAEAAAEIYAEGELVRQSERWGWEQSERERAER
jgi:hypothetical protein